MPKDVEIGLSVRFGVVVCKFDRRRQGPSVAKQVKNNVAIRLDAPTLRVQFGR